VQRGQHHRGHGQTHQDPVLVAVRRPDCLEACFDDYAVLCLPTGQRVLRADVLFG